MVTILWVAVIAATRLTARTWFAPQSVLALVLGVPIVLTPFLASEYTISWSAAAFLAGLVLTVAAGAAFSAPLARPASSHSQNTTLTRFAIHNVSSFSIFGATIGFSYLWVTLHTLGVGASSFRSITALTTTAQQLTLGRYTIGFDFPLIHHFLAAIMLAWAMLAALDLGVTRNPKPLLLLAVFPYVLSQFLITTRAPLIMLGLMWSAAFLFSRKAASPNHRFPTLRSRPIFLTSILAPITLTLIFFVFQVVRFSGAAPRAASQVFLHLRKYLLGGVPAFSNWFQTKPQFPDTKHAPGYYTFMGVFDNLGIESRTTGAYSEYLFLAPGESTNVFTAFRGLVTDFGEVGTFILFLAIGLAGGVAVKRAGLPALCAYILIASFLAYSPVASIWAYTSCLMGVACLPFLGYLFASNSDPNPRQEASLRCQPLSFSLSTTATTST
jgi:oligosaccharide repeat unit polymerase